MALEHRIVDHGLQIAGHGDSVHMFHAVQIHLVPTHHTAELMGPSGIDGTVPHQVPLLPGLAYPVEVSMARFVFLHRLGANGIVDPLLQREMIFPHPDYLRSRS